MLTSPVLDISGSSSILEPIASTSGMSQPLLENVGLLNINQPKARIFTEVPVPLQGGLLKDCEIVPPINIENQLEPSAMQKSTKQSDLSRKNKYLFEKCRKHMKKVYRLQRKIKKLNNKSFINKIFKSNSVNSLMKSQISPTFALLLQGEMRNFKKAGKGRKWDTNSKIVALRLFKRSKHVINY